MTKFYIMLVSVTTERQGRMIARSLIDSNLAKSVDLMSTDSFKPGREFVMGKGGLMVIKTSESKLEQVEQKIYEFHSQVPPEITSFPAHRISTDCIDWLNKSEA